MALFVANNGSLQTVKGIYYAMAEDYINATLFHSRVPKTATEIRFLYASNNPDLTGYQKIGYCDNNNFIEVWKNGTKYILINPRKNYIYAPRNCHLFLYNYTALTSCNMENFNTVNVTIMYGMFSDCSSLTNLDLSSFNTQSVTIMHGMFSDCSSLTNLDLSSFNTQSVTTMYGMFSNCSSLTNLDLSSFNTQSVTTMYTMFINCMGLTSLDLSSFNTQKVTDMRYVFYNCNMLQLIESNSFICNASLNSSSMFYNCTSLVGGNGTTFSRSHVNADYARVDGENGLPGYFTAPNN